MIIFMIPAEVVWHIFSFIHPFDAQRLRRLCRTTDQWLSDTRFIGGNLRRFQKQLCNERDAEWGRILGMPVHFQSCMVAHFHSQTSRVEAYNCKATSKPFPEFLTRMQELEVVAISSSLTGNLPASIGCLQHLRTLNLSRNCLVGPMPSSIGNLIQLQCLDLSENHFAGLIPWTSLARLVKLETLNLSSNHFSGIISSEVSALSESLLSLHLEGNSLSGGIPSGLGLLHQLKELCLGRNHLTGCIPEELGMLRDLVWIDLDSRHLLFGIPAFFPRRLTYLARTFLKSADRACNEEDDEGYESGWDATDTMFLEITPSLMMNLNV
ncbi:hypothetical protein BC830DRAFT_135137 [Chytriomyces sp. MP71]|nr:hypothetical protein BC830DRAFT_135137 [Chytriomyces sp. MP71]